MSDDAPGGKQLGGATTAVAGDSPSQPGVTVLDATHPAPIGRFIVLETLGAGGMGVVYAAYDPTLDRRIAVKLLRPRLDGASGDAERERMLREARALGRLDHPSILTVHDAGVVDGKVFIATELAGGGTLRAWQEATPRTRDQLLAAYVAAARGLAAAHDAGLVHRDFKPDNVLRTTDGRIRVADFGLVSVSERASEPVSEPVSVSDPVSDAVSVSDAVPVSVPVSAPTPAWLSDDEPQVISRADVVPFPTWLKAVAYAGPELTVPGTVLGTPLYMAPEQHRGDRAGPAADQFAFCVALWEALTGKPPFNGAHRAEIAAAIEEGPPAAPTSGSVPAWLVAVLARGLANDPDQRWPSMHALIAALLDDPIARRRRRARTAALALGVAGAAALIAVLAIRRPRDPGATCALDDQRLAAAWSPARATAVRNAFAATALPYAPAIAERAATALDARATQLRDARREACRATRVSGEQSEAMLDRRMSCLERRVGELDALAAAFAAVQPADRRLVDGALDAIAALPALDGCADVARLGELTPPPADPAARTRVEQLYVRIAAPVPGRPIYHAPDAIKAGYQALRALEPEVAALQHPPLAAALALRLAELAPSGTSEPHLREALRQAAAAHDDTAAATAWEKLVRIVGVGRHRHDEADLLRAAAEAAAARAGRALDDDPALLDALSEVANDRGDFAAARDLAARAVAAAERTLPVSNPRLGSYVADLATAERFAGHHETALTIQRRAVELHTAAVGADHPATIYDHVLEVTLLVMLGRAEEGLAIAEELRTRAARVLGDKHPYTGGTAMVYGDALSALGRTEEALAAYRTTLAVFERAIGPEHIETINVRTSVATALAELGRLDESLALQRTVLASYERNLGAEHPRVAQALLDLGTTLMRAGRFDEARPLLDRAVHLADTVLGPHHTMTLGMVSARAKVDLYSGHLAAAMPWLERHIALADETVGKDHPRAAMARYDLVLARWDQGRRDDARALAREIIDGLRATGSAEATNFADHVARWLADHP